MAYPNQNQNQPNKDNMAFANNDTQSYDLGFGNMTLTPNNPPTTGNNNTTTNNNTTANTNKPYTYTANSYDAQPNGNSYNNGGYGGGARGRGRGRG
eukprot:258667_1